MKGILILFFICISAVFTVAEGQYIVYFSQGTVSKRGSRVTVSYTHLDVYKRQV